MAKKASEMKRRGNNEGNIRLRADGKTWEGSYTYEDKNGNKKRRYVYGKSDQEVKDKITLARAEVITGENIDPDTITLEQWGKQWLDNFLLNARESTRYQYEQNLRLYVYPRIGSVRLQKVTKPMVQMVITKMLSDGRSPKTCKNVNGILHHLFEDAIESEYIRTNPAHKTKLPKVEKKELCVLSDGTYSAFLQEISEKPFEHIFFLAVFSGMREGEILGLTWDCVDFEAGKITVKQQLKRDSKIGEKNSAYILADTKTGNHRTLVLDSSVFDTLKKERSRQAQNKLKLGKNYKNEKNLVFTDDFGNQINGRTLLKAFKKRVTAIGLPEMRFHDLRHSFATQSFRNGDSVIEVQRNLGHTQASTTLNVYAHCTEEMQINSAKRMGDFIKSLKKESNAV